MNYACLVDDATARTLSSLPTPCYVLDERVLERNLCVLHGVEERTGARILLAQKAFSCFAVYPLIGRYLSGTTASGLYEARLAHEEMKRPAGADQPGKRLENHVFAPAFKAEDMDELLSVCDHIVFNSYAQYCKHRAAVAGRVPGERRVSIGIRVNPACSTQNGSIYDPCAPGSRLGMTYDAFRAAFGDTLPADVEGLHFHTLCEQNADDLVTTFRAFEARFAPYLRQVKWLNMGGGHHITRADYDLRTLEDLILSIRSTYGVEVYLEPGEAVALDAGWLVTEVQDIVRNGMDILILDASAECHNPDIIENAIRLPVHGAYVAGEGREEPGSGASATAVPTAHTYRLSSMTCLAGDVFGDYTFAHPVSVGDRLFIGNSIIYSMVKNNTFNGMPLPSIYLLRKDGTTVPIRSFGYQDFKGRLS